MKRSYSGLIVMTMGLIGIIWCVISNKSVDIIVVAFLIIGMIWSLFSSLFLVHKKERIGTKSLIIIFAPIVIGVIVALTGANASLYVALCGLFVISIAVAYLNRNTNS